MAPATTTSPPPAPPDDQTFTVVCYIASVVTLLGFAGIAVRLSRRHQSQDVDTFLTARRSQPLLRVAWSFFASSIGAWAIFLPAAYTSFGGWLSIITYAVSTGLPLLLISEFGRKILKRAPDVLSLNDFARRMYGRPVQLFVIALSLVNMGTAMIAELTGIGQLFESYVGGPSGAYIIVLVAVVTAVYTASGGLLVSILTDRLQAGMSLLLILVAALYLCVNFREPLRQPLPERLGVNYSGLSSIFSLPISLLSSACYQESFWQRVWAAEDKRSLRYGAMLGFVMTTVVIAFFGLVGFLGQWAALPPLDDHNNLAFFVPFSDAVTGGSPGSVVIRVLLVVLATTMNESAVDSLQNAIVSTLSSSFLADKPVSWSRALVFAINAPIVLVALQGYAMLDLFLAMNILTTCSTFPLLSALWLPEVSGATVLLSSAASLFCTCLLGVAVQGRGLARGLTWTFTSQLNQYDWRIFVVAALTSVFSTFVLWFMVDTRRKGFTVHVAGRSASGLDDPLTTLHEPFLARCCRRSSSLRHSGSRAATPARKSLDDVEDDDAASAALTLSPPAEGAIQREVEPEQPVSPIRV